LFDTFGCDNSFHQLFIVRSGEQRTESYERFLAHEGQTVQKGQWWL